MTTRSIAFRKDVNDELVAASDRMHISINWLVNQLCREGLDRLRPEINVTMPMPLRESE